jgi:hypothetical protein
VLTALQLAPLLVERKTPPRVLPAKRFVPDTVKEPTGPPAGRLVCIHWAFKETVKTISNKMGESQMRFFI